jgi:hypothetical protein
MHNTGEPASRHLKVESMQDERLIKGSKRRNGRMRQGKGKVG